MRVLLVRPPVPEHTMGLKHIMVCEPLELEYVAAGLEGHDVRIMDLILERGFERRLRSFRPHVVGTSSYITGVNEVIKLCRAVKRWNPACKIVVGGVHASQAPEDFADTAVDCIVRGDGTTVMPEVVEAFQKGRSLLEIPGLAIPEGSELLHTAARSYMPQPDLLPLPRRDLVRHLRHRYYYLQHRPVATIKTTWGCWYECNFCFTWRITGGQAYSRSPESIVEEIEALDVEDVYIVDDIFLINRRRLSRVAALLRERGIRKKYLVYARADFVARNEDVIAEWAELGLRAVFIGLEAVTNPELDSMDKQTSVDQNREAIAVLRRNGVDTYGSIITQPDYTAEDWERLWRFVEENELYYLNISPLTPLPGTSVWRESAAELTVPRQAHGLFDLSHVLLPTRVPLREYYDSLLRLYVRSCLNFGRARSVSLRDRAPIWSRSFLRLWFGAFKIWLQMRTAHRHHRPRELERAVSRGPEVAGLVRESGTERSKPPVPSAAHVISYEETAHPGGNGSGRDSESLRDTLIRSSTRGTDEPLLSFGLARRWFSRIRESVSQGTYTFQEPSSGRRSKESDRDRLLDLSSYDYLGLLGHPDVEASAIRAVEQFGTGAGGVRLLSGTNDLHLELEESLARLKETEAALVVDSGYSANLAAVTSLFGPRDTVFADERAHRSLVDAARLAGARLARFSHNDLEALERQLCRVDGQARKLIAVDGVYSMDGDVCPLPELVELKRRHGAFLLVDEAHSLGVLGCSGRGTHEHFGVSASEVDLWTGSLSKAIPSNGGFIAASQSVIVLIQHAAAQFMFSAALGPPATAAAIASIAVLAREPARRRTLVSNAERLRSGLRDIGFDLGASETPLIPVILGPDRAALELARDLRQRGISVSAVVSPAVPSGSARLRLCATAGLTTSEIDRALEAFDQIREATPACGS